MNWIQRSAKELCVKTPCPKPYSLPPVRQPQGIHALCNPLLLLGDLLLTKMTRWKTQRVTQRAGQRSNVVLPLSLLNPLLCEKPAAILCPIESSMWQRWLKAGREGNNRGWDGWMASPTQWRRVWTNSGRWRTERPGMLQSVGLQRVKQDWATEQQLMYVRLETDPAAFSKTTVPTNSLTVTSPDNPEPAWPTKLLPDSGLSEPEN